jgi:apolipoprotein N-acyltransferase
MVQTPFNLDFEAGDRQTIFQVQQARIGVLICYESILPDLARRAVKSGGGRSDYWIRLRTWPHPAI